MSSIVGLFLGIGIFFNLLGCIGLLRMPDVYNRLQAATKCVTLGTWSILFAHFLHFGFTASGIKALIGIPLLFLTSTVAAHSLARGSYIFGIKLWKKSVKDDYKGKVKVKK
ncbi:MAG: monovalent cation/H(+) antiporter subunit G [Spirochaetes bacterium]|nr:monovalent cation/H(+) antiporter subunit G [Spirochaetota bacterium]